MVGTGHKNLFHFWFDAKCRWADTACIYRYFAVCKNFKVQNFSRAVKNVTAFFPKTDFFRKKYDADGILTKRREVHAQLDAFIKEKFMRHLDHDPGSVTCIVFATTSAAVLHIFKHCQGICYVLV